MRVFLTAAALLLVGCQKNTDHFQSKRQLNINFTEDPATLDPRKGADFSSSSMHFFLYEGLVRLTPDGEPAPAVAESIDVSDDGLTYTFHLKECRWNTGEFITAYDFEKTWRDMLDPSFPSPNAHLLYPIKNAECVKQGRKSLDEVGFWAVDDRTFVVELQRATPYFLKLISFCVFSPVNKDISTFFTNWADEVGPNLVTNGPFMLTHWVRGGEMVLEKNHNYWDADNVNLEKIHISLINNEMTALQMYEKGDLDLMGLPYTDLPSDSIPNLRARGLVETSPAAASTVCFFNTQQWPFTNPNIRKAFAYSIDRAAIIENITQLGEQIATDTVPGALKDGKNYSYFKDNDLERARVCLEKGMQELGISREDLSKLVFMHANITIYPKIAQALQAQWRSCLGVDVKLEGYEYKTFMGKLVKRDYQFAEARWIAQYSDQINILDRFQYKESPKNYSGWFSPRYCQLLEDSFDFKDPEERLGHLERAEAIIAEEMPFTVLYHWNNVFLKKSYIKELYIYPTGGFHIQQIQFEKE